MNLLHWIKFDLTSIAERFLELAREHYWLSVVILWLVLIILVVYVGSVVGSGLRRARALLPALLSWYIALAAGLGCAGLLVLSIAATAFLRGMPLPVPSLPDLKVVLGEDEFLRWDWPPGADDLAFQVQWSTDASFPHASTQSDLVRDTIYATDYTRNQTLYLRVRAVDVDAKTNVATRLGAWSQPVKIDQYDNALEKIKRTRRIVVAMENEFGRSKFRWYEPAAGTPRPGEIVNQAMSYQGVDVEIAYAIADEICRKLLQGRPESGKQTVCRPSRPSHEPEPALCKEQSCARIEVRFVPVPWSEVMKSVGEGRHDMAISSITYVPEREDKYNILFSTKTYERTGHGIVWRNDGSWPAEKARYAADAASLKGKRVGVQPDTTGFWCVQHLLKTFAREEGKVGENDAFRIVEQTRDLTALAGLVRGQASFDLLFKDGTTADGWQALHGNGIVVESVGGSYFGADAPSYCHDQEYRVAVRAREFDLQELIDSVLEREDLDRIKQDAAERYAIYLGSKARAFARKK